MSCWFLEQTVTRRDPLPTDAEGMQPVLDVQRLQASPITREHLSMPVFLRVSLLEPRWGARQDMVSALLLWVRPRPEAVVPASGTRCRTLTRYLERALRVTAAGPRQLRQAEPEAHIGVKVSVPKGLGRQEGGGSSV